MLKTNMVSNAIKRTVTLILALTLSASLFACAAPQNTSQNQQASSSSSQVSSSSQAQSSAASENTIETTIVVVDPEDESSVLAKETVSIPEGKTVYDALEVSSLDTDIQDSQYGKYLVAINGVTAEGSSGWVYTVNGEEVMESIDAHQLKADDTVEFKYITM